MEIPGYQRIKFHQRFEQSRRRAQLARILNWVAGKPQTLLPFWPIYSALKNRVGFSRGVQEIPLRQIVGSFDKATLFDRDFRPLSDDSRTRWVNMLMQLMTVGWEPIVVHKIGNLYFVEDGHHRVSVGRAAGLQVIEAYVVEYPPAGQFSPDDDLETILRRLAHTNMDVPAGLPQPASVSPPNSFWGYGDNW